MESKLAFPDKIGLLIKKKTSLVAAETELNKARRVPIDINVCRLLWFPVLKKCSNQSAGK